MSEILRKHETRESAQWCDIEDSLVVNKQTVRNKQTGKHYTAIECGICENGCIVPRWVVFNIGADSKRLLLTAEQLADGYEVME